MAEPYGRIMGISNRVSPFEHFHQGMDDAGFDFDEFDYQMILRIGKLNIEWDRIILYSRSGDAYNVAYYPAIEEDYDYISFQMRKSQRNWDNHFNRVIGDLNMDPTDRNP